MSLFLHSIEKKTAVTDRRTLLRTREADDMEDNFVRMEIKDFVKLDHKEAARAYKQLLKAVKAVYSGSVDPLVNQLDFQKVKTKLNSRTFISEQEMNLIEELA